MDGGFPSDNLYFQNLPADMTEETIKQIFGAVGYTVVRAKVMPPTNPAVNTCAAMVQFRTLADAKTVLESFNGACLPGFDRPLSISYKRAGGSNYPEGSGAAAMAAALATMMGGNGMGGSGMMGGTGYGKAPVAKPAMLGMQGGMQPYAKPEASDNLYIKGLPGTADDSFVEQLFNQYGKVLTCKVLKKGEGPNCHAMVRFSSAEEASNIMNTLNGGMLEGFTTPLEISFAQSKMDRANSALASGYGGETGGQDVQAMLDEWVKAKRTRDYASADSIRAILRAQGVDPDTERPKAW